jgi:hypothetical protein
MRGLLPRETHVPSGAASVVMTPKGDVCHNGGQVEVVSVDDR